MQVSVRDLSVSYGAARVIERLSLEADTSTVLTVLGASGSGKSTFLRVLSGLGLPAGSSVDGSVRLGERSPAEVMATGRIGFVFQHPSLFPNLTAAENIELPLRLRGLSANYAEELLGVVGLDDSGHKLPSELSGGMRTRVAIARTLVTRPDVLLLDEPFTGLDFGWRYRLYRDFVRIHRERGMLTVLVTHDIEEALLLSHRVVVLRGGRFVDDVALPGTPERVLTEDPLQGMSEFIHRLRGHFVDA